MELLIINEAQRRLIESNDGLNVDGEIIKLDDDHIYGVVDSDNEVIMLDDTYAGEHPFPETMSISLLKQCVLDSNGATRANAIFYRRKINDVIVDCVPMSIRIDDTLAFVDFVCDGLIYNVKFDTTTNYENDRLATRLRRIFKHDFTFTIPFNSIGTVFFNYIVYSPAPTISGYTDLYADGSFNFEREVLLTPCISEDESIHVLNASLMPMSSALYKVQVIYCKNDKIGKEILTYGGFDNFSITTTEIL